MEKGERVTLITKIASALAERTWAEIDLILDQFEFGTSDAWNGDTYSYVVEFIKRESDSKLIELHAYLFPGEAPSPRTPQADEEDAGGTWDHGYFRLFVSHSSEQSAEGGALKAALRPYAISAFVAHDDIDPTEEWRDVIEVALRTCEAMAAYVTPDFHPSKWTDQEVGVALARAILLIPIKKGVTPYGFMGKYQALPGGTKGPAKLAEEIHAILASHALTKKRLASDAEGEACVSVNGAMSPIRGGPA
jgi:hypothetical protein